MKLCSLELENFRQFYGNQKIDFSEDDKNITVILGENGNGKTGIFRAIIFCLFGENLLPKDRENKGTDSGAIHLVNLNSLKENPDYPIEAKVILTFTNKSKKYFLERSVSDMYGSKNDTVIANLEREVKLSIQNADGNMEQIITKEFDVDNEINSIINNRVKDLFFFDGDKIETLSTTNKNSREEIKNGIMRLLQIDSINKAIDITSKLESEQHKTVKEKSDTKLQVKENELEQLNKQLDEDEEKLDIKNTELQHVSSIIEEYEHKQQENKNIKDFFEKRNDLSDNKKKTELLLDKMRQEINSMVSEKGHFLLSKKTILKAMDFVEQEEKNNDYSSGITTDLLDEILNTHRCVCNRDFNNGDITYLHLQKLRRRYEKMEHSDFIRDFKRNMKLLILAFNKYNNEYVHDALLKHNEQTDDLENLRKKLDDIEYQKSEFSQSEVQLKGIENSLRSCRDDSNKLHQKIGEMRNSIESTKKYISIIEQEIKDLRKRDNELHHDNNILEYYEDLNTLFTTIRDSYSRKMRARLSEESTAIFKKLISNKDFNVLNRIVINENYEIQAKGWNDISIFQDISSGQKQMLSLSFVAALAKIAAGGVHNVIDMPLFMDTPFAKLDGNNRDNLINTMPELTSQWILLVTDTEFARSEVNQMKSTNRWGKFYRLDKKCDGYTEIVPISDVDTFAASR